MLDQTQIILIILIVIVAAIGVFICTGFIYNKDGYISIIERRGNYIATVENKKLLFYLPVLYRKVGSYPIGEASMVIKKDDKKITAYYIVNNVKKYHYSNIRIKEVVLENSDFIDKKKKLQQCGVNLLEVK